MRSSGCVYLLLILCLFLGIIICAGCTQKAGPSPLVIGTPGVPVSPGPPEAGIPAGTSPDASRTWCNGRCADLSAERENCGACGALCPTGQICQNTRCISENPGVPGTPLNPGVPGNPGTPAVSGTYATSGSSGSPTCSSGQTNCYGSCVDLLSDTGHCGTCNTACPSGKVCSAGICTVTCGSGLTNCGGSCVNTQTSSQHCGKCNNACSSGQSYEKGKCGIFASPMTLVPPTPTQVVLNQQATTCTFSGKLWCSGACISQDASNCGSCGHACKSGESCSGGSCLSWTGSWTMGPYIFKCVQTGTTISCNYHDSGLTTLIVGTTSGSPPRLTGTVSSVYAGGLTDTGTLEFDMSADGKQFTGWAILSSSPGIKNTITGTRT